MKIICNGYIDKRAGSVASASYLMVEELLRRGHNITFVSKKSFVYPTCLLKQYPNLQFVDATNHVTDWLHESIGRRFGPMAGLTGLINHRRYSKAIVSRMQQLHAEEDFDVVLFLGLAAFARIGTLKMVSWIQGPPGSDVYSLREHAELLRVTESRTRLALLKCYGYHRMRYRLPDFGASDRVIVGSRWSEQTLTGRFGVPTSKTVALPYPMDLNLMRRRDQPAASDAPLEILWLGRIVPRKRLDLLLDAASRAILADVRLRLTVVGEVTFAPGLRRLLEKFPHQNCLHYIPRVERSAIPELFNSADVLCQPSDEEDFGSSVAEAMACGIPAIVGPTNGTGDYLCPQSVQLKDNDAETLASTFAEFYRRKRAGTLSDVITTRAAAERNFSVVPIVDKLERILVDAQ